MKLNKIPPVVRIILLTGVLYIFLISINLMGASFKALGKGLAGGLFDLTTDPFIGLFIGILATSLVQSSSTTTVIVVGLVAEGVIPIPNAIPIVMGANIGTSITNTIVSLGSVTRNRDFQRSFAAATVHDFFNLLAVVVIFPLQYSFNILGRMAYFFTGIFQQVGGIKVANPIKLITKPVILFIKSASFDNGWIMLIISIVLLFIALKYLTELMRSLVISKLEKFFDKYIFVNGPLAFLFGIIITSIVQSSSVTTSLVVPLVGVGILNIYQIFPYTLGANIGTTITGILAALATGQIVAITVAFAHLSFNILGTAIFWPLKFIPIFLAETLASVGTKRKFIPLVYLAVLFFLVPVGIIFYIK